MLKIQLTPPVLIRKKYFVFLDSETKKAFNSKRDAEAYITTIENELNEALLFINEIFSIISVFYRTYFIADRDSEFKFNVQNQLELIDLKLIYVATHTGSENFNAIISQALNICFESLDSVCQLIGKKSRTRYDMLTRRRISLYGRIISQYRESFEHFKRESIYSDNLKVKTA